MAAALLCLLALVAAPSARAAVPAPQTAASPAIEAETEDTDAADRKKQQTELLRQLKPQHGKVTLPGDLATLQVPENFCFLNSGDATKVVVDLWGNPPQAAEGLLGMLMPVADGLPAARDYGVVISFEEEGYIKDGDADSIKYNELLKKMQESTEQSNAERVKAGYESIRLVGWATPPRYDKQAKKLYWAKELAFGNSAEHGLNYDIRVLGRRGVLKLSAVAGMEQLQEIEQVTPAILGMVDFNQGHRYADFNPKTDKVAEYGLAALVAGGILAKAGGFKLILAGLLAAKKFIIIGLVAVGGFIKKLFGGKGVETHDTPSTR